MDPLTIAAIGEKATNAVTGIGNWFAQMDQNAWQRQKLQEAWQREDTAAQRRAADLQAAGLSKTLAAGSPAQSSQAPQIGAPQLELGIDPLAALSQIALIHKTEAEKKYIDMQTLGTSANTQMALLQRAILERDFEMLKAQGLRSRSVGGLVDTVTQVGSFIDKVVGDVTGSASLDMLPNVSARLNQLQENLSNRQNYIENNRRNPTTTNRWPTLMEALKSLGEATRQRFLSTMQGYDPKLGSGRSW